MGGHVTMKYLLTAAALLALNAPAYRSFTPRFLTGTAHVTAP